MPGTRRVLFGRINRRRPQEPPLVVHEFADDMKALADSHLTRATIKNTGGKPDRTWIAADLTLDARGEFLTGVLGYEIHDEMRSFDEDSWSWSKGETMPLNGAPSATTVPFAIDLRPSQRWVAFATSNAIRHANFGVGLAIALNHAVHELNLWPTDWEFDPVLSRGTVRNWIDTHPNVYKIVRSLSFSNPGLDLDGDREEMRALGARRKTEEFAAPPSGRLNVGGEDFERKLDGIETGDAKIKMWARGQGSRAETFRSDDHADATLIDDFGTDLALGMELVLSALRAYRPPANVRGED